MLAKVAKAMTTTSEEETLRQSGRALSPAMLTYAFRPMFIAAGSWAIVAILVCSTAHAPDYSVFTWLRARDTRLQRSSLWKLTGLSSSFCAEPNR